MTYYSNTGQTWKMFVIEMRKLKKKTDKILLVLMEQNLWHPPILAGSYVRERKGNEKTRSEPVLSEKKQLESEVMP